MRVRGGYPVVDGGAFAEITGPSRSEQTIQDAIGIWLEALREALGETYEIVDSDQFVAISGAAPDDTDALLVRMETLAVRVRNRLRGIARDPRGRRRPLVLLFDSARRFDDYFTAVDEGDGERTGDHCAHFTGPWLDQFLFAPAPLDASEPAMIHGLAHTLAERDYPYWVREMVAAYAADEPLGDFDRDWSDAQSRAFRNGQSFFDDETRDASLARVARLARKLSADYDAFVQFVCKAEWNDEGEAAAREVFGISLRDLINR